MGCFPGFKNKKKSDQVILANHLPEPQSPTRSLQFATPSFRARGNRIHSLVTSNRIRALSAPSALDAAEQDDLTSLESMEQEKPEHQSGSMKEHRLPTPQPLPLPRPPVGGTLRTASNFKPGPAYDPLCAAGPLQLPTSGSLRYFLYEEIAAACQNFSSDRCTSERRSSSIYKASFGGDASRTKKFKATVTRLHLSTQSLKEFIDQVNTLVSLQHPNICRLLGFHARDISEPRMLVYERLYHGSLDRLLFGRSDGGPALDWCARLKIAVCAAQGLAFLHDEGPFQAMYNEFSTADIQIDKDFTAKLSGYGCVGRIPEEAVGNFSVETLERGVLTPKSNVWSFGIILLELLTGRKNLDSRHPSEERNLVKWCWPFLSDQYRLSMMMDPRLKGHYPLSGVVMLADVAQRCLRKEPSIRPAMRTIVKLLKTIQLVQNPSPPQEPVAISGKPPSVDGVGCSVPRLNFSQSSPPHGARLHGPFSRWSGPPVPVPLPPRPCSSTFSMEELVRQQSNKSSSSAPGKH